MVTGWKARRGLTRIEPIGVFHNENDPSRRKIPPSPCPRVPSDSNLKNIHMKAPLLRGRHRHRTAPTSLPPCTPCTPSPPLPVSPSPSPSPSLRSPSSLASKCRHFLGKFPIFSILRDSVLGEFIVGIRFRHLFHQHQSIIPEDGNFYPLLTTTRNWSHFPRFICLIDRIVKWNRTTIRWLIIRCFASFR